MAAATTNHFLVPKHYLLPPEQAQKILEARGVTSEQLPMIQRNDPSIKEFRPQRGDVIKIVRNSQTAGQTIYYRRVV